MGLFDRFKKPTSTSVIVKDTGFSEVYPDKTPPKPAIPLCIQCKHCLGPSRSFIDPSLSRCGHPTILATEAQALVVGVRPGVSDRFCTTERVYGICGPKASLWEPKLK